MRSPEGSDYCSAGKNSAATAGYRVGSGFAGKLRRHQKVPAGSCKTRKIIRYHYAFDPDPDCLTRTRHRRPARELQQKCSECSASTGKKRATIVQRPDNTGRPAGGLRLRRQPFPQFQVPRGGRFSRFPPGLKLLFISAAVLVRRTKEGGPSETGF